MFFWFMIFCVAAAVIDRAITVHTTYLASLNSDDSETTYNERNNRDY